MNATLRYALIFAGGIAAGVAATLAVKRGAINLKPAATAIISRGLDVKDAVASAVEKAKENAEDMMAEAKVAQAERKSD